MKTAGPVVAPVTVHPVRSRRDRRAFIAFPYDLYDGCAYWAAPLRRDIARMLSRRNPFLAHGAIAPFIAVDARGSVVGRIAAIVNGRHLERHHDGAGFFGFFECVEDDETAEALLAAAGAWLRGRELTVMRGPANPSINDCSGLLVEGFERRPSVLMPYNPPYYERFLLRHGFERAMTMWAYRVAAADLDIARLERGAARVRQRAPGFHVRKARFRQLDEKARVMCRIYNEAFDGTWGHVPLSDDELLHMAHAMRPILDANLVLFLEHDDRPVGFSLSVPDVNLLLRHVRDGRMWPFGMFRLLASRWLGELREFRVAVLALLPEYRGRGLDSLLMLTTIQEGLRRGYVASELSWILDGNRPLRKSLVSLGASIDKEYAFFERALLENRPL